MADRNPLDLLSAAQEVQRALGGAAASLRLIVRASKFGFTEYRHDDALDWLADTINAEAVKMSELLDHLETALKVGAGHG